MTHHFPQEAVGVMRVTSARRTGLPIFLPADSPYPVNQRTSKRENAAAFVPLRVLSQYGK